VVHFVASAAERLRNCASGSNAEHVGADVARRDGPDVEAVLDRPLSVVPSLRRRSGWRSLERRDVPVLDEDPVVPVRDRARTRDVGIAARADRVAAGRTYSIDS
jgi:hypothetical protein